MEKLEWNILSPKDVPFFKQNIFSQNEMGNDASLVSILFYQKKFNILCAFKNGILYRFYNGVDEAHKGYLFPLSKDEIDDEKLEKAVLIIKADAENNSRDFRFCAVNKNQKMHLENVIKKLFPDVVFEWKTNPGDSDYIYSQQKLSALSGSALQKKRNHVHQFEKAYGNWSFIFFDSLSFNSEIKENVKKIFSTWKSFHEKEDEADILQEENLVSFALENFSLLSLCGGLLKAGETPVAFCLASPVSREVMDVHFEKAVQLYAEKGAYAVINQQFAKCLENYIFINREEDLNIEGLRKAKLSYKPEIILDKFYSEIKL